MLLPPVSKPLMLSLQWNSMVESVISCLQWSPHSERWCSQSGKHLSSFLISPSAVLPGGLGSISLSWSWSQLAFDKSIEAPFSTLAPSLYHFLWLGPAALKFLLASSPADIFLQTAWIKDIQWDTWCSSQGAFRLVAARHAAQLGQQEF